MFENYMRINLDHFSCDLELWLTLHPLPGDGGQWSSGECELGKTEEKEMLECPMQTEQRFILTFEQGPLISKLF